MGHMQHVYRGAVLHEKRSVSPHLFPTLRLVQTTAQPNNFRVRDQSQSQSSYKKVAHHKQLTVTRKPPRYRLQRHNHDLERAGPTFEAQPEVAEPVAECVTTEDAAILVGGRLSWAIRNDVRIKSAGMFSSCVGFAKGSLSCASTPKIFGGRPRISPDLR